MGGGRAVGGVSFAGDPLPPPSGGDRLVMAGDVCEGVREAGGTSEARCWCVDVRVVGGNWDLGMRGGWGYYRGLRRSRL